MHALWKSLSLAIGAVCYRVSITPPSPPPTPKDQVFTGNFFERIMPFTAVLNRNISGGVLLAEVVVQLAVAYPHVLPPAILRVLCPLGHPSSDILSTISIPFVVGFVLVVLATALRVWCFRTLGRHFTFEVTLLRDHALVTQGPYAFVRHPSYTGCVFLVFGTTMMVFAPYGWVTECNILSTPLGLAIEAWLCLVIWISYSLCCRIPVEDRNLRTRFGKDWESYANDVPYTLIPGVY